MKDEKCDHNTYCLWTARKIENRQIVDERFFKSIEARNQYVRVHSGWFKRGKICSGNLNRHLKFEKATVEDLEETGQLYDLVCEELEKGRNFPGWKKGIYPTVEDAETGILEGSLYVCRQQGHIAGAVILNHIPEEGYKGANWSVPDDYDHIYVIHTLAVRPDYTGAGIGGYIMEEVEKIARAEGCVSLRLDVVKENIPAEKLYVRAGYRYVETRSLGYESFGLPWFNLYEKFLN